MVKFYKFLMTKSLSSGIDFIIKFFHVNEAPELIYLSIKRGYSYILRIFVENVAERKVMEIETSCSPFESVASVITISKL